MMAAAMAAPHESGAVCALLDEGRWHFQHGPIDLIIGVEGTDVAVEQALAGAWQRFTQILPELVTELSVLRRAAHSDTLVQGAVAQRMVHACLPFASQVFVTPMAGVAGSVADELIAYFREQTGVSRAYVNNGGDIALHVSASQSYTIGLYSDLARYQGDALDLDGRFVVEADSPVRGIATSGWRGRSFSLGIADSVTVLATSAAQADVAATLVANQINVNDPAIQRAPADTLKDDTDLGSRLVTVAVGPLSRFAIDDALAQGFAYAQDLCARGLIHGAVLALQGAMRVVGAAAPAGAGAPRGQLDFNTADGRI